MQEPKPEKIWTVYDSYMHSYGGHMGHYDKFDNGVGDEYVLKEAYDELDLENRKQAMIIGCLRRRVSALNECIEVK